MATEVELPVEDRILQLLQHLGIQQAHFAASNSLDWQGLVTAHPEVISSLTLVTPRAVDPGVLGTIAPRLLVFNGDRGNSAEGLQRAMVSLPDATLVALHDYLRSNAADVIADRGDSIGPTLIDFLGRTNDGPEARTIPLSEGEGEMAGISYRIRGSGPPLLLLPIEYAPSQWEPLLPALTQHYSTITLGGAWLGVVAILEARAQGDYMAAVQRLVDETRLQPAERVLDVGCGSGSLNRWLAHRTNRGNRIVGVDISPYLLGEAKALARNEGFEETIDFRQGNAEGLPFPDNSFDLTMSITVMEEVDAALMLAEMVRVTRSGGRIAVIVHAMDMPGWINLRLQPDLKAKLESPGAYTLTAAERGCADASLYQRFREAGLVDVRMFPQLAPFDSATPSRLRSRNAQILANLSDEEGREWQEAATQAQSGGTFIIGEPHHCAVGTKP